MIIFPKTDLNPYHYEIDGFETYSRNEAILHAGANIDRVKFYFMDHVWDRIDFSKEPEQSLEELAHRRCRQIREDHDWLCLWLSSGYDSQTVLKYFIDAGVKIDEIAHRDKSHLFDDPEVHYVKITAEWYRRTHNPNVKFTLVEHGLDCADFYLKNKEDWILQPGAVLRFSKTGLNNVLAFNDAIKKDLDRGPVRRADITGHDKPRLDLRDGRWWMFMPEMTMAPSIGTKSVDFYLPEHQPDFFVKQCYQAIKYFESRSDVSHELVHRVQSLKEDYAGWNLGLGRVPTPCIESSDGRLKPAFDQSRHAPDSVKLIQHLEKTEKRAVDLWNHGLDTLQSAVGDRDIFSIHIMSKHWPICEFGRFTKKDAVASV